MSVTRALYCAIYRLGVQVISERNLSDTEVSQVLPIVARVDKITSDTYS